MQSEHVRKGQEDVRPTSLSRRKFLQMSAMVGGGLVLAACAAPAGAPDGEAGGAVSSDALTISWWNGFSTDSVKQVVPQIIADFEARNPGIKVEYELSGGPPGGGQLMEVLLSRIAALTVEGTF